MGKDDEQQPGSSAEYKREEYIINDPDLKNFKVNYNIYEDDSEAEEDDSNAQDAAEAAGAENESKIRNSKGRVSTRNANNEDANVKVKRRGWLGKIGCKQAKNEQSAEPIKEERQEFTSINQEVKEKSVDGKGLTSVNGNPKENTPDEDNLTGTSENIENDAADKEDQASVEQAWESLVTGGQGVADEENWTSIIENAQMTRGEAREEASEREDDMGGGSEEKALKTPDNDPREQVDKHNRDENVAQQGVRVGLGHDNGRFIGEDEAKILLEKAKLETETNLKNEQSQVRKIITVIVIGLIVIAVASVGVWIFGQMHKDDNRAENARNQNSGQISEHGSEPDNNKELEEQLTELAVNDELVQGLYNRFLNLSDGFNFFYENEFGRSDQAHLTRLGVVLNNMDMVECRVIEEDGGLENRYGEDYAYLGGDPNVDVTKCFDGGQVREKALELFAELPLFEMAEVVPGSPLADRTVWSRGAFWGYDNEADEFYSYGAGIDNNFRYVRELFRAEKENNHVYLYEKVVSAACYPSGEIDEVGMAMTVCYVGPVSKGANDETSVEIDYALNESNFSEFESWVDNMGRSDVIDQIKWTFVKNDNGNYVFEKIEAVAE